jgi:phytoene/squalene synthetase
LNRFQVTEQHLDSQRVDDAWRALMAFEVQRARSLMHSGTSLALHLHGRIGWELRMVIQGGLRILEKIEAVDYDVFRHRPKLEKADWVLMGLRAFRM